MIKLDLPQFDPNVHFLAIANSKNLKMRARLNKLAPHIRNKYHDYHKTGHSLERVRPKKYSSLNREALLHCYTGGTDALDMLKAAVLEAQSIGLRHRCQYCGIGHANQIDHYLPKTEFPEFSVLAKNMVPSCGHCNGLKLEFWKIGRDRIIINPYYDQIVQEKYLHAVYIHGAGVGFQYSLRRPIGVSDYNFGLIERHFKKLNLIRRFSEYAAGLIDPVVASLLVDPNRTFNHRRAYLQRQAQVHYATRGPNSWETVGYEAMANCVALLQI